MYGPKTKRDVVPSTDNTTTIPKQPSNLLNPYTNMPLPTNWKTYYKAIDQRCQDLIDYNIWSGLSLDRYLSWIKNFKTDEEKYLAACLLDSLIYRSKDQTLSLIEDNISKNIINSFRTSTPPIKIKDPLHKSLSDKYQEPEIRLVLTLRPGASTSKGAHIIGRYAIKDLRIVDKYVIEPQFIQHAYQDKGVRTFVFIDDFSGTGETFCEVYNACKTNLLADAHITFAPLVIHQKAIDKIKTEHPEVNICYAEKLNESHSFFTFGRSDFANTELMAIYNKTLKSNLRGIANKYKYGYGELGLLYVFEHSCPNNSLPVLFYNREGWSPLFNR